jgi:hypothetical protein
MHTCCRLNLAISDLESRSCYTAVDTLCFLYRAPGPLVSGGHAGTPETSTPGHQLVWLCWSLSTTSLHVPSDLIFVITKSHLGKEWPSVLVLIFFKRPNYRPFIYWIKFSTTVLLWLNLIHHYWPPFDYEIAEFTQTWTPLLSNCGSSQL